MWVPQMHMGTTTARIYEEDYTVLKGLSEEVDAPMSEVLAELLYMADMEDVMRDLQDGSVECPDCGNRFDP